MVFAKKETLSRNVIKLTIFTRHIKRPPYLQLGGLFISEKAQFRYEK